MGEGVTERRPYELMAVVIAANAAGNFFLTWGLRDVGQIVTFSPWPYLRALSDPLVLLGVALLITWLISQLSLLSRADMSYAMPVTGSGYILTALLGYFFLDEGIPLTHWAGIAMIGFGVALVGQTKPRTNGRRRRRP